ncbi:MAG TPA: hypothetical protein VGC59_09165 [Solirubrobacteraceae bacterium]
MPYRTVCLFFLLIACAAFAGCGSGGGSSSTATTATTAAVPALARRPPATGEIVIRGEASPATHGPYDFNGRYRVRFQQYAPEDPKLDFSSQTPFSVALTRNQGDTTGAVKLFQTAARSGRRELTIRGRYYVEVSFGDFPYVVRFTPRSA